MPLHKVTEHAKILKLNTLDSVGRRITRITNDFATEKPITVTKPLTEGKIAEDPYLGVLKGIHETPGKWLVGELWLADPTYPWRNKILSAAVQGGIGHDMTQIVGELKYTVMLDGHEAPWMGMGLQPVFNGFIVVQDHRSYTAGEKIGEAGTPGPHYHFEIPKQRKSS